MSTATYPLRPRCYFAQYGTIASVVSSSGDPSRIRVRHGSGVQPPVISSGVVGPGFAALTAREGNQSRIQERLWAP